MPELPEEIVCWRCGLPFATYKEMFDHRENDCTETEWSDYAEHH